MESSFVPVPDQEILLLTATLPVHPAVRFAGTGSVFKGLRKILQWEDKVGG